MFKTFDYDVELDEKNHIIAHLGGQRCLIDTGSPVTLCEKPVEFGTFKGGATRMSGIDVGVVLEGTGWTLDNIRKLSGLDIDALVGTDVLSTSRWYVDPFKKILTVGALPKGKVENVVGMFQGNSPVIEALVGGEKAQMLIDTGANVNFVSRRFSEEWPVEGKHKDFYPTIGKFEVPLRRATFKAFGYQFGSTRFADLPNELDQMVEIASMFGGVKMHGIAGMDILNHGSLGFDLRGGVVVFSPRES